MVQVSGEFAQLVDIDPVLTDIFYQHYNQELGMGGVMQLFQMADSSKAKETDLRIGSFSDPVEFTGTTQYTDAERGFEVEYTPTEYRNGFQVTRKMRDDMQYPGIFASASELGASYGRFRRKSAASVFNNAFNTANAGYDAFPLCDTLHVRSRTDSTTVSNEGALSLTSGNLETSIVNMQGLGDDLGEEITIMPNVLVVPRALRKTALEIIGSDREPGTANNTTNVHEGQMQVIVDPYLEDTNAWFIVDSTMAKRYLKWFDRVNTEFTSHVDFDTLIWKFAGYMRFSFGWSDFRWIYGNNPS
jgi:hypothetical protein